jgi:hypothetical protein
MVAQLQQQHPWSRWPPYVQQHAGRMIEQEQRPPQHHEQFFASAQSLCPPHVQQQHPSSCMIAQEQRPPQHHHWHAPAPNQKTGKQQRRRTAHIVPEDRCHRCGMTQEEHSPLRGRLEKHHAVPLSAGGHPTDPSNLHTLCYFCHREWHTFWEGRADWQTYMSATPFCQVVQCVPARPDMPPPGMPAQKCWKCGISEARCLELRPARKAFQRFKSDAKCNTCYWCLREWEIFWQPLRSDLASFTRTQALRPLVFE